jgi:hypothetical protein
MAPGGVCVSSAQCVLVPLVPISRPVKYVGHCALMMQAASTDLSVRLQYATQLKGSPFTSLHFNPILFFET